MHQSLNPFTRSRTGSATACDSACSARPPAPGRAVIRGNRIAIIGNAGGGKTALARKLGTLLDLPVIHVDSIQYQPGWRRTPVAECDRMLERAARSDRWIIDGFGNDDVIERRLRIADTVVFIDFPMWRVHRDHTPWFRRLLEGAKEYANVVVIHTPAQWHRALDRVVRE